MVLTVFSLLITIFPLWRAHVYVAFIYPYAQVIPLYHSGNDITVSLKYKGEIG